MKSRIIGVLVLGGALTVGCVSTETHQKTLDELDAARREQAAASGKLQAVQRKATELQQVVEAREAQIRSLQQQLQTASQELNNNKAALAQASQRLAALEEEEKRQPAAKPAEEPRNQFTITILAHLLFDSGDIQITPAGRAVLKQISGLLKQDGDKQIRVVGHTDNKPIKDRLKKRFQTNWELSTGRATSVVRYLIDEEGIEPTRFSAVGYADTYPVAGNETEEGRQQNRRIEIVLYPKSLTEPANRTGKE